jgi:hypothetical protein
MSDAADDTFRFMSDRAANTYCAADTFPQRLHPEPQLMGDAPRIEPRSHRCAARPHRRPWRAAASALALACAAFVIAACDDGGGGGGSGVEYFPVGGVSESMRVARRNARLNLDHTVVTWLEAAGGHDNDTGSEDGVDEFIYHFDEPTEIRLSLDRFDEAPQLIALDASGKEVGRATAGADATITLRGEITLRVVHPHAGDAYRGAVRRLPRAMLPEAQANPNDVATLKASKSCPFCNLGGLSWNACPSGASLAGIDISHADFTMANLACVTFQPNGTTPVLLTGAIFNDASLNQVTLKGVDLTDAQFSGRSSKSPCSMASPRPRPTSAVPSGRTACSVRRPEAGALLARRTSRACNSGRARACPRRICATPISPARRSIRRPRSTATGSPGRICSM